MTLKYLGLKTFPNFTFLSGLHLKTSFNKREQKSSLNNCNYFFTRSSQSD